MSEVTAAADRLLSAFEALLSAVPASPGRSVLGGTEYALAGLRWTRERYSNDELSAHPRQEVFLNLKAPYQGAGCAWHYTEKIAKGIYVRTFGRADTLVAAAEAAVAFCPEVSTFEYLGQAVSWYRGVRWTAAIEGEESEIFERKEKTREGEGRFSWMREYAAASEVLALTRERSLTGTAQTPEAAMRACVDAPERFRRACGALVARHYLAQPPGDRS